MGTSFGCAIMLNVNEIYHGDCLELFKKLDDNSINVVFADPPFNLAKKYQNYRDNLEVKDYLDWCDTWLKEIVRVTAVDGSIFIHNIPKWLTYFANTLNQLSHFRHWISWDAPTAPMGKSLQPSHYGILYYSKSEKVKFNEIRHPHKRCRKCKFLLKDYGGKKDVLNWFGPLVSDCWSDIHRVRHKKNRDAHPCQLPIHLLERIILMSSDVDDVILDPFSGTATTAIAAKRMGRKYIGFELSEQYLISSRAKLEAEKSYKLNNSYVSMYLDNIVTMRDKDWDDIQGSFSYPENKQLIDSQAIKLA